MKPKTYTDLCNETLGYLGRLLSWDKYDLPENLKGHKMAWNANIVIDGKKYWYGDIDLDGDSEKLQHIANELRQTVYVLREMAARFDNEENPDLDNPVAIFHPEKS